MKSPVLSPSALPFQGLAALAKTSQRLVGETRTRILLLYALTLLAVVSAAIPVFRALLFREVDQRVQLDLQAELEDFQATYQAWDATDTETESSLQAFVEEFLATNIPEDDNFHLVILNQRLVGANPSPLPTVLQPDSPLMQQWMTILEPTQGRVMSSDPAVGGILYQTAVLEIDDRPQGLFIVAHLSAGERQEALVGITIFTKVAIGVVAVAFLLAWVGSRQLLKPVQDLAATARSINEADLSRRLAISGSGELAELANTFNAMMNRVQSAFDSQRNFINDASHELFTPLTIIQGHLELMGDDPDERAETLDLVMDELERMGRFVNDLLLLAKSQQPDFLQLAPLDVDDLTQAVFTKATVLADRQWHLGGLGHGCLMGDRQRLTGALLNLVQNAVQHSQPTDTIEIGSSIRDQQVRFWVRDTGSGIAPSDQARIFNRFARAANIYRPSEGAGLGLAIVKTIAESHGGIVELVSQVGVGSTFTLVIPQHLDLQEAGQ